MFDFLESFFHAILYQPLFNSLVLLYNYIPGRDFGIAIIFLTLIIRIILYPISVKSINSQTALQKLQPQIQELQKKYKNDKEKQAREVLDLYKKEKINPFSGVLLALIQLPILIALYQVFWTGLDPKELAALYNFVFNPGQINPLFLTIIDLSKPSMIFAILAGLAQYYQTKMLIPQKKTDSGATKSEADFSVIMQKQMVYFAPILTVIILANLPSALGLYWIVGGVFSIIQQYLIFKKRDQSKVSSQ